jgi:hypothetical protein
MNDTASVQLLTTMLEIYSPSGKEKEISDFLVEEMERLGFRVRKDEVGNVIGEIGEGKPVVLLCGHMDTVRRYIPVRVKQGKKNSTRAVPNRTTATVKLRITPIPR